MITYRHASPATNAMREANIYADMAAEHRHNPPEYMRCYGLCLRRFRDAVEAMRQRDEAEARYARIVAAHEAHA